MLLDGRRLNEGTVLSADVAVVGAGPAGIVVALELAERGHRVLLLESGGATREADPALATLAHPDPHHVPMALATRRQLGGASNLWGGRCVPFDPSDFDPRPLVGQARWPVTYREVAAYYQRASNWCRSGDAVFDAQEIPSLASRSLVPRLSNADVIATSLERWSLPTNFGRIYRGRLHQCRTVTLATHVTCTEIVTDHSCSGVIHLIANTPRGCRVTVTAAKYVLSCGGLETTRLLFASTRHSPAGLGNHSGHLGRWYMAHVDSRVARVRFTGPPAATIHDYERDPAGVYVRRRFTFAPEVLAHERLSNAAIWLVNPDLADPAHRSGVLSFVYLALVSPLGRYFISEGIRQAHIKCAERPQLTAHLTNLMSDLPEAAFFALRFAYGRYVKRGRKVPGFFVRSSSNEYLLQYHGEHLPNWESYVKPSGERDAFGMPRLITHLSFADDDVSSVISAHRRLDRYLREQRLGQVDFVSHDLHNLIRTQLQGGYHQAGTTRMAGAPDGGVVDRDLGVHGFNDLFIASSSVFVTSSQANSTFTLIAFAVRLADHLHRALR